MAWITLTPDQIPVRADEREQVDAAVGRGDTLPEIIASTVRTIRGRVSVRNPLGAEGTIPDELEEAAKAIIAWRYLAQAAADDLLTKGRETGNTNGMADLKAVATGDIKIVPPEDYAPHQAQSPSPRIISRRLQFRPENLDGI